MKEWKKEKMKEGKKEKRKEGKNERRNEGMNLSKWKCWPAHPRMSKGHHNQGKIIVTFDQNKVAISTPKYWKSIQQYSNLPKWNWLHFEHFWFVCPSVNFLSYLLDFHKTSYLDITIVCQETGRRRKNAWMRQWQAWCLLVLILWPGTED